MTTLRDPHSAGRALQGVATQLAHPKQRALPERGLPLSLVDGERQGLDGGRKTVMVFGAPSLGLGRYPG